MLLLLALAIATPLASDETCEAASGGQIEVIVSEEGSPPVHAEAVLSHLRAELARRNVAACSASAHVTSPIARVVIHGQARDEVVIDIHDLRSARETSRTLTMTGVPDNARPLQIGIAATELWLAFRAAPVLSPPGRPPAPPQLSTGPSLAPALPATAALDAVVAAQVFGGSAVHLGPELCLHGWSLSRVHPYARLGFAWARPASGADGEARSTALSLGVGAMRSIPLARQRVAIDLQTGVDGLRIDARGVPAAGAQAGDASAYTAMVMIGGGASVRLSSRVLLLLRVEGGRVLRDVRILDDAVRLYAVSGWTARLTTGLGVRF